MQPSALPLNNSKMTTTASRSITGSRFSLAAFVALGLVLAWLIAWLPYAAGYADHRRSVLSWLLLYWKDPTWQHGALAVPIAAFLVWRKRKEFNTLPAVPSVFGLVLALFSLGLFWIGYRGNYYYFGFAGIHLLLAGMVWWIWGWRHLMVVSFAWFILGFAWPYLFLEEGVAFRLRFLMVSATEKFLNLVGVATLQDGTRLVSAATESRAQGEWFSMNVDGPCSGLRSLFALMMVSALFSYFRQRTWWRRAFLFALSIPLAVLANMIRIIILTFATMMFGEQFALGNGEEYTSNFHLLTGLFMFVVSLVALSGAAALMNRIVRKEKPLNLMED